MKIIAKIILLLALLASEAMAATAVTYVSIASGTWSTTSTWAALKTGTITTTTASKTVTGSGTSFSTQFSTGQKLYTASGVLIGTISSIGSNTSITLSANAASANSAVAFYGTSTATPGSIDTATIMSPNTVSLSATQSIANITVSSGGTLALQQQTLSLSASSASLTNNGTVTDTSGNGILDVSGSTAVISGSGTFAGGVRVYTSGTAVSIASGASLTFAGTAAIRAGRNANNSTVSGSVLTINGTLSSTQTAGTSLLRFYANSTVISTTGIINAANSTASYSVSSATVTNNGSVNVQKITRNSTSNKWTQGANSSLTVSLTSTVGTLYASATGNTVTYNGTSSTDISITVLSPASTYYNLAGTAVVCPTSFTILGTSPCQVGVYAQTKSPTSCVNVTGIGSIAWTSPTNATASDNVYSTASNVQKNTATNYLRCTGYGFSIPAGSTINGISVNVERKTSGGTIKDNVMYLVKNVGSTATIQATNRSSLTSYTTSDVIETHGSTSDLWSGTWTYTDINSSNFGAAFSAYNTSTTSTTNRTVSVDHMPITVVYTPATAPDHVAISAPAVGSTCYSGSVTITLHDANHTAVSGWNGTLNLTTSDSTGDWSLASGAGSLNNGTANDGAASYTFATSENKVVLNLTHTTTGAITLGVKNGSTDMLANTTASEKINSITYPTGGSFVVVSNATGTPVPVTSMNQIAGTPSTTYYLYGASTSCAAAFTSATKTVQFASLCNNPTTCQNSTNVVTITPVGGSATPLQKGLPNGTSSPTSGQYTNVSLVFDANSRAPFKLSYDDTGQISLYMYFNGGNGVSSIFVGSPPFVVKPAGFVLSGIKRTSDNFANPAAADATGTAFIAAGKPFTLSVTALTASGATKANAGTTINCTTTPTDCTPNFGQEINKESVQLIPALVSGLGLIAPGFATGSFGAFSGGIAQGTTFAWDEVGIITLTPRLLSGDYLGMDTANTGTGDVVGTTSAKIGRFYPDHFSVTADANAPLDNRDDLNYCSQGLLISDGVTPCLPADLCVGGVLVADGATACVVAPGFTYMGEQMAANFTLSANNATGTVTENYIHSATPANNFAKLNPIASGSSLGLGAVNTYTDPITNATTITDLTARLDTSNIASSGSGSFTNGNALISAPLGITRSTSADGPYTSVAIGIAPVDSDGVKMGTYDLDVDNNTVLDHTWIGTSTVRYGRLKLANGTGSEHLPLALSLTAEYWYNGNYVTSAEDNNTVLQISNSALANYIALSNYQRKSGDTWTTSLTLPTATATNGLWSVTLAKPGTTFSGRGSVDISASTPTYLPSNIGRATFGVYTGNKHLIYMRESY